MIRSDTFGLRQMSVSAAKRLDSGASPILRVLLALGVSACAGCAGSAIMGASPQAAELVLRKSQEQQRANRAGGIFLVDGRKVAEDQRYGVRVSAGSRRIAFLCPGWMFIDGFPSIRHRFEAGHRYELVCDDGPSRIEPVEGPDASFNPTPSARLNAGVVPQAARSTDL